MFFFLFCSQLCASPVTTKEGRFGTSLIRDMRDGYLVLGNLEYGAPKYTAGLKTILLMTGIFGHYNLYTIPQTNLRVIGGGILYT